MNLSVGTFNLNNLFSRWNFAGADRRLRWQAVTLRYEFTDPSTYRIRTFRGRLIREKAAVDTDRLAGRIMRIDIDVLAVQEVENIATLREFNAAQARLDVPARRAARRATTPASSTWRCCRSIPLGAVTSHQTRVSTPNRPTERVFSRDLLEVEVLDAARRRRFFTLYTTHLKSKFVPFPVDPVQGAIDNDARRRRQAETIARLVAQRQRPDGRYVIFGDMNDAPDAGPARAAAQRSKAAGTRRRSRFSRSKPGRRPLTAAVPDLVTPRWTHRFKPSREPGAV